MRAFPIVIASEAKQSHLEILLLGGELKLIISVISFNARTDSGSLSSTSREGGGRGLGKRARDS